jgi:hypothetical protein
MSSLTFLRLTCNANPSINSGKRDALVKSPIIVMALSEEKGYVMN